MLYVEGRPFTTAPFSLILHISIYNCISRYLFPPYPQKNRRFVRGSIGSGGGQSGDPSRTRAAFHLLSVDSCNSHELLLLHLAIELCLSRESILETYEHLTD